MNRLAFVIRIFLCILIAVSAVTATAYAQISLQVGGGLGYVAPAGDFGGTTIDFYSGSKYGLSGGINIHGKGRLGLAGLRLAAEIGYSSLSNSGESEPGQGKVDVSQKILSFKIGPEIHLNLPASPLTPYFGASLIINRFSGEVTFNGVARVPSGTFSINSATRSGIGISGGGIIKIGAAMFLDVSISYNMLNLFGKGWEDANPRRDDRIDSYTSLNDDKDPVALNTTEHFIGSDRTINTIQISVSVLFGV